MAIDLFGPDGAARATSVRPVEPTSSPTDSWFADCIGGQGNTGTPITARWLNRITAQLRTAVRAGVVTESHADDAMLVRAIRGGKLTGFDDLSTTANALTIAPPNPHTSLFRYLAFRIFPANTNSSRTVTLAVNALAPVRIKKRDGTDPAPNDILVGQPLELMHDGSVFRVLGMLPSDVGAIAKTPIVGPTTFYIATTGSDSTGDGTAANPWKTGSYAYSFVQSHYDARGNVLTFSFAAGTYADAVTCNGPIAGAPGPNNIVFSGPAGGAATFSTSASCFNASNGAQITVQNVNLASSGFFGLYAGALSAIQIGASVTFNTCAQAHVGTSAGTILYTANWTMSGNSYSHIYATDSGANINFTPGITGTLSGPLAFPNGFIVLTNCATAKATSLSFSGPTANGPRNQVTNNAVLSTNGTTIFPGNTAGGTGNGGQST